MGVLASSLIILGVGLLLIVAGYIEKHRARTYIESDCIVKKTYLHRYKETRRKPPRQMICFQNYWIANFLGHKIKEEFEITDGTGHCLEETDNMLQREKTFKRNIVNKYLVMVHLAGRTFLFYICSRSVLFMHVIIHLMSLYKR